jgi:hypothetical protein
MGRSTPSPAGARTEKAYRDRIRTPGGLPSFQKPKWQKQSVESKDCHNSTNCHTPLQRKSNVPSIGRRSVKTQDVPDCSVHRCHFFCFSSAAKKKKETKRGERATVRTIQTRGKPTIRLPQWGLFDCRSIGLNLLNLKLSLDKNLNKKLRKACNCPTNPEPWKANHHTAPMGTF